MTKVKISAEIRGLKELRRAARKETLIEVPLRGFFADAVALVVDEVKAAAPGPDSGGLAASIKGKVLGGKVAKSGKVTANASRDGFRYGYALNASDRYHRDGSGATTKGWFDDVKDRVEGRINQRAERMGDEIERAFS